MIRKDEVQLEVVANGNPARKALAELDMEAQKLKNTMRDNKRGTEEYINASKKLKEVEAQMAGVRKEIGLNQMTLKELNKELASLKNKRQFIDPMTDAFKENRKAIEAVIARKKELESGLGSFGQSMSKMKDQMMFAGVAGAVLLVTERFNDLVTTNIEFEKSLRNLQALTGVTTNELKFYNEAAREIGRTTTTSAIDAVEAFKLIASAKPDLLNAKEALVSVTKEAIALSNASGLSLPEAATRLTDAMNQFSAPAREAGKYVNILAEGARLSAAEVPDITSALLEFGVAAKGTNVSISESVALIEAMAEKGVKGAEAGTKLRNVLAKGFSPKGLDKAAIADLERMGVNLDVLSNKNLSLQQRLQELAKIKNDDIALTHVFGLENKIAAQVILENTERVNELSAALGKDGLTSAYEQAHINTQTLDSDLKRLKQTWESMALEGGEGGLNGLFRAVVQGAEMALRGLNAFLGGLTYFRDLYDNIMTRSVEYNEKQKAQQQEIIKYEEEAKKFTVKQIADRIAMEQQLINILIKQKEEKKKQWEENSSNKQPWKSSMAQEINDQVAFHAKKKQILYDNFEQIKKANEAAAKSDSSITSATITNNAVKIKQIEKHIEKIKELQNEFFKLTGYKNQKEMFDAMEAENAYQDKLAASRAAEPAERDRQNNIDTFGYGSLSEMVDAQGDADVQADKEAAEREKRAAKEEEERQAFLKLEKDKQDAQAETFDNWLIRENDKIQKTIQGFQKSYQIFGAFDNFKRVKENAEIERLGENSERAKQLRIEQARREKNISLAEAFIATALGIAQNLDNPFAAAAAGITGAIQIATIKATEIPEMRKGGLLLKGASHDSPSRGINIMDDNGNVQARAEGGEALIAKQTYRANKPLIDAMMNNYGKTLSMDWLYQNTTANVKGFGKNQNATYETNTTNNYNTNKIDGLDSLLESNIRIEKAILSLNDKQVALSLYELKKAQKEIDIIERNAAVS